MQPDPTATVDAPAPPCAVAEIEFDEPVPSLPEPPDPLPSLSEVEQFTRRADLVVADPGLLQQAFVHRSLAEWSPRGDNERLEFLGDSILGMLVSEHLYARFPDRTEGQLTRLRARLVSRAVLATAAERLGLGELIRMAAPERAAGGCGRPGTLADAFEALLAAIYLSAGLEAARGFLHRHLLDHIDPTEHWDHKSRLQELMQDKRRATPTYRILDQVGPAHERRFVAEAVVKGAVYGSGSGRSKKDAEQAAAADALAHVDRAGRRKQRRPEEE